MRPLRAARKDGNHAALRTLFRSIGGSWLDIVAEYGGEPDALLGWRGENRLIEIKDPEASNTDQKLRLKQVSWHRSWRGRPVAKVTSFDDILELFK